MRLLSICPAFILVAESTALTYWLDKTCRIDAIYQGLEEAIKMGERSSARLLANDAEIQTLFRRLYHTDTTNTTVVNDVRHVMHGVSQLTPTEDHITSDFRIYCADEFRWTPPGHHGTTTHWHDYHNGIRRRTLVGEPGCLESHKLGTLFDKKLDGPGYEMHSPKRATMSICRLDRAPVLSTLASEVNATQPDLTVKHLRRLHSSVLLHEFVHHPDFGAHDRAYGWKNATALTTEAALENADSYAMFGVLSMLEDHDLKLSSNETEARMGKLVPKLGSRLGRHSSTFRTR